MDLVHFRGETVIGFVEESGGDDLFYAGATSGLGKETRVNAVAGDDAENLRCGHAGEYDYWLRRRRLTCNCASAF